ncbi:hypothetical protein F5Y12DRAFT_739182 [Xylaria sp. FL1777]|nr:hypothetical protein F5Y12DRAFT_739182 [Xylaria sp. FL1777]
MHSLLRQFEAVVEMSVYKVYHIQYRSHSATMSTVNFVRYFWYVANRPRSEDYMRQLIALAYQTATAQEIYPQEVLVRSDVHDTTTINGKRQKDPKGDHVTFSYKSRDHLGREVHVACHGYVTDRQTLEFREATHAPEKPDDVKNSRGNPVWPTRERLWEAPEVGYGHMLKK